MRTKTELMKYAKEMSHTGVTIYFQDHDTIIIYDMGKLVHYEFNTNGETTTFNVLKTDKDVENAKS